MASICEQCGDHAPTRSGLCHVCSVAMYGRKRADKLFATSPRTLRYHLTTIGMSESHGVTTDPVGCYPACRECGAAESVVVEVSADAPDLHKAALGAAQFRDALPARPCQCEETP